MYAFTVRGLLRALLQPVEPGRPVQIVFAHGTFNDWQTEMMWIGRGKQRGKGQEESCNEGGNEISRRKKAELEPSIT